MADFRENPDYILLERAIATNQADWVRELAQDVRLHKRKKWGKTLLVRAAAYGHAEALSCLIDYADPKHSDSIALFNAVIVGRADNDPKFLRCIEVLLPVSDTGAWTQDMWAAVAPEAMALIERYDLSKQLNQASSHPKPLRL